MGITASPIYRGGPELRAVVRLQYSEPIELAREMAFLPLAIPASPPLT
jgi:hypothetical protein